MRNHKKKNWQTQVTIIDEDKSRDYKTLTDKERQRWSNNLNDKGLAAAGYKKQSEVYHYN